MLEFKSTDFTLMLPNILVVIFFSRYYKSRLQQCCDTIIKVFSVGWTITISWSLHFTIKVFFLIFFANHTSCVLILIYMIIISRVRIIQERDECDTFTFT